MSERAETYDLFGELLQYPSGDFLERVARLKETLKPSCPGAFEAVSRFEHETRGLSSTSLEELFTRTFDLNPECSPEVGWHLFGERYDRGTFLVWMRGRLREHAIRESDELPDHLSHVLPVLARMGRADSDRFAADCVLPALERMLLALGEKENPFEHLLMAMQDLLISNHGASRTAGDGRTPSGPSEKLPHQAGGE